MKVYAMLVALGLVACLGSGAAEAQQERDSAAMVSELEMPRVGQFIVSVTLSAHLFESRPPTTEVEAEIQQLEARRDLTGDDLLRLFKLHDWLGHVLEANEAAERAASAYEAALAVTPADADALRGFGAVTARLGRETLAEEPLRRALEIEPDDISAYGSMCQVLYTKAFPGIVEWGRACAQEFVRLYPERMAEMGYTADHLPPLHVPDEWTRFDWIGGSELTVLLLRMRDAIDPDGLATAPGEQRIYASWIQATLNRIASQLGADPTPEGWRTAGELHLTVAGQQALLGMTQLTDDMRIEHVSAVILEVFFSTITPQLLQVGEDACDAHPEALHHRATVGSLEAMRILDGCLRAVLTEGADAASALDEGQVADAIANLTAAMALPDESREGLVGALAFLHLASGDLDACFATTSEAIARGEWDFASVSAGLMARMGFDLGQFLEEQRLREEFAPEMLQELESTLAGWLEQLSPQDAAPYGTLASFRAKQDDWVGAAAALDQALVLAPTSQLYASGRGVALLKAGQADEAVAALRAALELPVEHKELVTFCHKALGTALLAAGQTEEAERELGWAG